LALELADGGGRVLEGIGPVGEVAGVGGHLLFLRSDSGKCQFLEICGGTWQDLVPDGGDEVPLSLCP
jgi:hypothetical protein